MTKHRASFIFTSLALLLLASGCLTPILVAPSSAPVANRSFEVIGPTQAESCLQSILGIPISFDASLNTTLAKARDKIQADALVELTVDRYSLVTGFYNQTCTVVNAKGIRYTDSKAPFLAPVPAVPAVPAPAPAPAEKAKPVEPAPAPAAKAKPAEVKPAVKKKLTRAEKRKLAAQERKRKAQEKRQAREEAKRKAAEEKKAEADKKRAAAEEARRAEDAKKQALVDKAKAEEENKRQAELAVKQKAEEEARRKAAEENKPVPAEFEIYCKYNAGQQVSIETKSEKIAGEFLKCTHKGVVLNQQDKGTNLVPFKKIWGVRMMAPPPSGPATPGQ